MMTAELRMIQTGIIAAAEYLTFGFDETMPLDAGGGNKLDFVVSSSRSLRLLEREAIDDSLSRDLFSISRFLSFEDMITKVGR